LTHNNAMYGADRFKLGFFGFNTNGGLAIADIPERWVATWDSTLALTRAAEAASFDFMLPIARWHGHQGKTQYQEEGVEGLTWAAAAAHATDRIVLFATVHVPMFHPIVAAKQMADIHNLLNGRFGLNIVCGWNIAEMRMFGLELRERAEQYAYANEWLTVVRRVWGLEDGPEHFQGKYFQLEDLNRVQGPRPLGNGPILFNAGTSPAGLDFAARNCDFLLHNAPDLTQGAQAVSQMKTQARGAYERELGVILTGHIICRPTRAEAREYHEYVLANADIEAAENLMSGFGLANPDSYSELAGVGRSSKSKPLETEVYLAYRDRFVSGHGTFGPIVGTPDDVAACLQAINDAGYEGFGFSFTNFYDELPYFRQEVMPRLQARGLREPPPSS
jgi:dimethylsulfone monooxygenase